jgi:alpha-glucosidase
VRKFLPFFVIVLFAFASCAPPATLAPTVPADTPSPPLNLKGAHDGAFESVSQAECRVFGWAVDANQPERDLQVRVLVDGEPQAEGLADAYRFDLDAFKRCPGGTCAFDFDLWNLISRDQPYTVLVQVRDDSGAWRDLDKSPRQLTCVQLGAENSGGEPQTRQDPSGRVEFRLGPNHLILEFLDDDLLHFEISGVPTETDLTKPLFTSPMVAKRDYPGPSRLTFDGLDTFETAALRVRVEPTTLCLSAWDISRQPALALTTFCPFKLGQPEQGLTLTPEGFSHAYGLGEMFSLSGDNGLNWVGRVRAPGSVFGNAMVGWNGGGVGNAQFPIIYFTGPGYDNYALFADNAYAQTWNLRENPWKVSLRGKWLRFYLMTGPDLQDLRQDYLELVGRPPVPPKKAFGLWVSEYGYDNWAELDDKLRTLRANRFPLDGFVLDLQWFGGVQGYSDNSRMGSLDWDLENFPNPAAKIASLRETQGLGIIVIEEPYISRGLPEHRQLAELGYLARACKTCPPSYLTSNPWWGQGGMLDWSNPAAGAFWHDWKREPLIAAGVMGHWTDLGEPEMFDPNAWYYGLAGDYGPLERQADIHNLYNLLWSQSVYEGYQRNGHSQRPFILSRSGAPGSQRYGVSMWSGDIGSNLSSLSAQMTVQAHMSLSGMDYFGSDIGGFHRGGLDGDLNEMYTRWFASSSLLDVPVRAHTENLCNCKETAPDRIGDRPSNLANIRLRYALSHYLYSLSHRAYLYGEPVFPPLVYYYQDDPAAREIVDAKLIGRDLLAVHVTEYGLTETSAYLPAGDWYDYYSHQRYVSRGQVFERLPLYRDGLFRLPLFVRAGAILPLMYVDEQTLNLDGLRADGSRRDELIVRVYANPQPSHFDLYEDDGVSLAYQTGQVRVTPLSQRGGEVVIGPASGGFDGAPDRRGLMVEWVSPQAASITEVRLNGSALPRVASREAWEAASSAWFAVDNMLILVKIEPQPVAQEQVLSFR